MDKLQEKLDFLLDKYAVSQKAVLEKDTVWVDGKAFALLPWRQERRFTELRQMVKSGTVGAISHFKIMSLNPRTTSLEAVIRRELDTARFIGGFEITEVFAVQNGGTASVLAQSDTGAVVTLELDTTLPEGSRVIDKHEIITTRGTACDRAMDSQTPLSSLYVYGADAAEYTDVDFELYGLLPEEVAQVRQAFEIAKYPKTGEENNREAARLAVLLARTLESAGNGRNLTV